MNIVGLLVVSVSLTPGQLEEDFSHDFRQGMSAQPALRLSGPNPQSVIQYDSEGMRIKLSAKRPNLHPVGVVTKFHIQGDFVASSRYAILSAENPPKGYGSGARLFATLKSPSKYEAVSLGHVFREGNKNLVVAYHVITDETGKVTTQTEALPMTVSSGTLRLARTGTKFSFQVAKGASTDFQTFYEVEVGDYDLDFLQLTATTGEQPAAVDVRFRDLHIEAKTLSNKLAVPDSGWLVWIVTSVVGVLLAGGLWFWMKKRRTEEESEAEETDEPKPMRRSKRTRSRE